MVFRILSSTVVVLHFAFIAFVATGALLALRWPRMAWVHLAAMAWGVGTVTVGFPCPLTGLEKTLGRWAGDESYPGGFVDRYIEDVIYPESLSPLLQAAVLVLTLTAYAVRVRRSVKTRVLVAEPHALA